MRRMFILMAAAVLVAVVAAPVQAGSTRNFAAPLDGGQEVPAVDTNATGVATFKFSKDGSSVRYKLNVANIDNVVASHVHCAPAGSNGPVGVTLFSGAPGGGPVNGTLAQGILTAPDGGNGCGWADLAAMQAAMASGDAYVNVHTFPGTPSGEIRGQVK